jgi:hypothetical protein
MFVHCHAHILNLVVCDSAEVSSLARDTFSILKRLYAFFSTSPKRHGIYERFAKELCHVTKGRKLLQLSSTTRWTARSDNLETVHNCLPAIVASLLRSIQQFDFVLAICVLRELLLLCRSVSEYLQAADMDMLASLTAISDLTNKLQVMRDDCTAAFRKLYEAACAICCTPSIGIALPTGDEPLLKRKKTGTASSARAICDG